MLSNIREVPVMVVVVVVDHNAGVWLCGCGFGGDSGIIGFDLIFIFNNSNNL